MILFEFIAALIGIIITIREGKAQAILEDQLMSKQTAVIQKLSDSADITAASQKATAGTLQSLQGTMERMNRAVQGQLALFYDVSLNVFWDAEIKQLRLSNNGRTNISLVGVKFADKQPRFIAEQVITPNAVYTERVSDIDDATASLPKETSRSFPILLYLKNAKQEEFVVEQNIDLYWEGDKVSVRTQTSSIRPERWSRSRKEQK